MYFYFTKLKFIMNHISSIWELILYSFSVIFASYYLNIIPFSSYAFNLTLLWLSNNMTMMGCNLSTLISLSSESRYSNIVFMIYLYTDPYFTRYYLYVYLYLDLLYINDHSRILYWSWSILGTLFYVLIQIFYQIWALYHIFFL